MDNTDDSGHVRVKFKTNVCDGCGVSERLDRPCNLNLSPWFKFQTDDTNEWMLLCLPCYRKRPESRLICDFCGRVKDLWDKEVGTWYTGPREGRADKYLKCKNCYEKMLERHKQSVA